jgi:hypothetical protein
MSIAAIRYPFRNQGYLLNNSPSSIGENDLLRLRSAVDSVVRVLLLPLQWGRLQYSTPLISRCQ